MAQWLDAPKSKLNKILKSIDFSKVLKIINLYKLYIIIKDKVSKYKFYIYFKKYLLDLLVYSNITKPFNYSYKGSKYFITFLNDYDKRLKVEILEKKSNIYITYLYYIARNKWGNIKIYYLRTNYNNKYLDYKFNNL